MRYPMVFVGTRQQLDHWMHERLLGRIGHTPDQFHTCAVEDGQEAYDKAVAGMKVIAPLGEEGLWATMMENNPMRWVPRVVHRPSRNCVITPLYAPSRLLPYRNNDTSKASGIVGMERPARLQGVQQLAIRRAVSYCKELPPAKATKDYLLDPTVAKFNEWTQMALEKGSQISFDIETPYKISQSDESEMGENELASRKDTKQIIRISFAYKAHNAVSIPWDPRYMDGIRKLLGSPFEKIVWNGRTFDIPLLRANDMDVCGDVIDGMDMWHYYQSDLPKGLEHVSGFFTDLMPWKHLNNSEPALYSCIDSDAAYLIVQGLTEVMQGSGQLDMWRVHDQQCMKVLDIAGSNGIKINTKLREELRAELSEALLKEIVSVQGAVPEEWRKAKLYQRPNITEDYVWVKTKGEKKVKICEICEKPNVNKRHPCFKEMDEPKIVLGTAEVDMWYKLLPPNPTLDKVQEWLKGNGFNPNSSTQLIKYMKHYRHPVARNWKTDKDMADSKHLVRLAVKYPEHKVYGHTVESHKISKALSTYILETDALDQAYTTYVNSTSTWRLGSRNINVQNQGKKGNEYAMRARATIIARDGRVFVQADSSAIEAVFTGVFMDDDNYIEIAKRSVHAYLCCKWLGMEFTKENAKKIKSEKQYAQLYNQMKRVVHGTAYGMGPMLMHMNEPEIFPSLREARRCQDFLFQHLPKLKEWQQMVRMRAKKEGYLENPWGLRHYFYDVFTYEYDDDGELKLDRNGDPKIKAGSDKQRVVAFLPQSSGGLFMRENLVEIHKHVDPSWLPAIISVHDSYCLETPDNSKDIEYAVNVLEGVLTRKIPQMNNIRVGCEIEMGKNWKDMEFLCANPALEGTW